MKYGFTIPGRGPLASPDTLLRIARHGEELGFDSIQTGDHILVPKDIDSTYPYTDNGEFPGLSSGSSLEQLTLLAFLAGQTSNIRLVTSVLIVPHRNPLVAAKTLATLDVLSKGRLVVGIGVGWMKEEFEALGLPPFEERGAVTNEYLRIFKELWTSDNPSYTGKYCSFSNINFLPKPVQKPHPPLWVGGESMAAVRRAAELCDGWYPIGSNPQFPMGTPDLLSEKLKRLHIETEKFNRDPSEVNLIYRTHDYDLSDARVSDTERNFFTGSADQIASDIRRYEETGVGYMVMDFGRNNQNLEDVLGSMEDMANEVWPKV